MKVRSVSILFSCIVSLPLWGCTYPAWYEGFQESARQKCYEQIGEDEIQRCLDEVNSRTYEEYREYILQEPKE